MAPWVDDVDEEEVSMGQDARMAPDELFPSSTPPPLPKRRTPEVDDNVDGHSPSPKSPTGPPRLPKRRGPHRVLSSSPEEDSHNLPSWVVAQEEEARARSTLVDEDAGL